MKTWKHFSSNEASSINMRKDAWSNKVWACFSSTAVAVSPPAPTFPGSTSLRMFKIPKLRLGQEKDHAKGQWCLTLIKVTCHTLVSMLCAKIILWWLITVTLMSVELQLLSRGCHSSDLLSQAVSKSASKELSPSRRRSKNLWQYNWLGQAKDQELCIEHFLGPKKIKSTWTSKWLVFGWEIKKKL